LGTWNAPHGHSHEWRRKRHRNHSRRSSASPLLRYAVFALSTVLVITLLWRGIRWTAHPAYTPRVAGTASSYALTVPAEATNATAMWQRDYKDALDLAAQDASEGNISQAEIAVDRAETVITAQRLELGSAPAEFFAPALAQLDRVLAKHSDDARLAEHVTLTRISLAEFRTAAVEDFGSFQPDRSPIQGVQISAPREISANERLDPASLGGKLLDANSMADTAEILLPPSSRKFIDNIRVENLAIQGAAQTLDGIHWRNVTFLNTRLRYEGGELDLQNVHFVRCRFGFTTDAGDDRSARLANAIALGQYSITIQ
jgi:hypothetical protein